MTPQRFSRSAHRVMHAHLIAMVLAALAGMAGTGTALAHGETRFINSADKIPVAFEVHGSGSPALVFVHGWSCDRSYWAAQIPAFAERFTVVTLDLGGHGQSGIQRRDWTIASYGRDVEAVVQALKLRRVVLIGHSMGGDVVTDAARYLKRKVVGLIWLDTYKQLGEGRSPESVEVAVAGLRTNFPESSRTLVRSLFLPSSDRALVDRVVADMSSARPDIALPSLHSSLSHSREIGSKLQELKLRVIAINPDDAPTDAQSMARYGVDVTIMPGVGHFLMMEDPTRLNTLLRTSIDQLLQKQD
jgi:pimeloyl-ACP methyl ester carboxylesterase